MFEAPPSSHSSRIEGILVPTLVPLDSRGGIDEKELRRFLSWLIARGVHGIYPNGSTGEFTRFSAEERRRIVHIVCDEVGGRVPVIAGAAEANVRETLAACDLYARYGARAAAVVAPYFYRLSQESIYAYFREIALNSPLDITLYNIPSFANPIELPTLQRLAEYERIVGLKDSSGDLPFMMRMISAIRPVRPDFSFLTGWEAVLVPMLLAGADGGTHASANVAPEITRRLYELTRAGKIDEAMTLQQRFLPLFDAMLSPFEFPDGFRAGAELRGFNFGKSRQPASEVQLRSREHAQAAVERLLHDLGVLEKASNNTSSSGAVEIKAEG